jgi:hypothetical protein
MINIVTIEDFLLTHINKLTPDDIVFFDEVDIIV